MIQAGKNITTSGDSLFKMSIEHLYHAIKKPKLEIQSKIQQLRIVRNIDAKQYAVLKRQLPYFVAGVFNPAVRRTENFAFTSYFIVDIDHISEKGETLDVIRSKVEADSRVMLSFVSPSEDGLKLMFRLKERCYDAGLYSIFYKSFLYSFSNQYGLEQVADARTSDVTRACFISYDNSVYYNPQSDPVDLASFVDVNNPFELFQKNKKIENETKEKLKEFESEKIEKEDVDADVINHIKTILGNAPKRAEKPTAYVPEELDVIIGELQSYIMDAGVIIKEIKNINYGKKIKAIIAKKEAEINLFFGKRGFTVVQSPRTGTSAEMNQMLADLIEAYLITYTL